MEASPKWEMAGNSLTQRIGLSGCLLIASQTTYPGRSFGSGSIDLLKIRYSRQFRRSWSGRLLGIVEEYGNKISGFWITDVHTTGAFVLLREGSVAF